MGLQFDIQGVNQVLQLMTENIKQTLNNQKPNKKNIIHALNKQKHYPFIIQQTQNRKTLSIHYTMGPKMYNVCLKHIPAVVHSDQILPLPQLMG